LLSGDREELNKLDASMLAADTTLTYAYDATQIAAGRTAVDLEVMYVWSVNESAKQATIERAMVGSVAADHADNADPVEPEVLQVRHRQARSTPRSGPCPPPNGLFQVRTSCSPRTPCNGPTRCRPRTPTPSCSSRCVTARRARDGMAAVTRHEYSLLRSMPTRSRRDGVAARHAVYPGRTGVVYGAPFTSCSPLADDVVA
jgi:hypothetical protein